MAHRRKGTTGADGNGVKDFRFEEAQRKNNPRRG